jgi:hypothetical protein
MRGLVLALAVFLLLRGGAEVAMAARWEKAEVPAYDFTPETWRPYVQANVADFNANMPPEVPRLIYTPMGERSCEDLPPNGPKGGLSYCVQRGSLSVPGYVAEMRASRRGERFVSALVAVAADHAFVDPQAVLCHETTHGVTDVPDDYALPHADESCVQGRLSHLGAWDIAYAAAVYSDDGSRRSGHHRSRHRSH